MFWFSFPALPSLPQNDNRMDITKIGAGIEDVKKNGSRVCLECGSRLPFGRSNMKFCCSDCRNRYHNRYRKRSNLYHGAVDRQLNTNYKILDNLMKMDISQMSLPEMVSMGFNPYYSTLCRKDGCHLIYACYEILYQITDLKIFNIRRMSLNL